MLPAEMKSDLAGFRKKRQQRQVLVRLRFVRDADLAAIPPQGHGGEA